MAVVFVYRKLAVTDVKGTYWLANKQVKCLILLLSQVVFKLKTYVQEKHSFTYFYFSVFNWQLDGSNNNQYLDLSVCLLGSDWLNAEGVSAKLRQ